MSLDAFNARALLLELTPMLERSRLQKFSQLTEFDFLLHMRAPGTTHRLLFSIHPDKSRFHLLEGSNPPAVVPSPFVMLCRKRVVGCWLESLEQPDTDRRLVMHFHSGYSLALDWAGRPSGLVLLGPRSEEEPEEKVVTAHIPSRGRFRKGHPMPSEEDRRPSALTLSGAEAWNIWEVVRGDESVARTLGQTFSGWPPVWAKRFQKQCQADNAYQVAGNKFEVTWDSIVSPLLQQPFHCTPAIEDDGEITYCAETAQFDTLHQAAQARWLEKGLAPGVSDFREELLKTLCKNRDKAVRKLKKREQDRKGAESAPQDQMKGDLLLAYATGLPRGTPSFKTQDWEGRPLTIELDPKLSPTENADRFYTRAKKKRRALEVLAHQIQLAKEEIENWDELLYAARTSENQTDLEQVRKSMPGSQSRSKKRKTPEVPSSGPRRYRHGDFQILVGRNPVQNEKLSLKTAAKDDHWFHVRQGAGSHVLVRAAGLEPPPETLHAAAWLAAKHSSSSTSGAVEVVTTRARFLKKPKGGPLGKVIYRQETEVVVNPTSDTPKGLEIDEA